VEVVASLSQGRTAAAQCGLFTHKSVPVIFEPPCIYIYIYIIYIPSYSFFLLIYGWRINPPLHCAAENVLLGVNV